MTSAADRKPVCVVVGVGPGNGAAIARRFAGAGYALALIARSTGFAADLAQQIGGARAYACDIAETEAVASVFGRIREDLGDVDVLVFNAGTGNWGSVETITPADFEAAWRTSAFGTLLASQQVIPAMKRNGHGDIIIIGATASLRGVPTTAAVAPAKAAQRILAESMARSLGPAGIHVAVLILDGVVDLPATRAYFPDKPDDYFIKPAAVAQAALTLVGQDRSAWSFQTELRPFGEKW
jgi:NAD(P)-dependent dehydrogenase (short-subunit alcohol dehydrogenase family)